MRGYLLIITSGILFFIISAITVLHLMTSRTLSSQYDNHRLSQEVLDFLSIKSLVAHMIAKNSPQLNLPNPLNETYSIVNEVQPNGETQFTIMNQTTGRESMFTVYFDSNQANSTAFVNDPIVILDNQVNNINLSSSIVTHIVQVRALWLPSLPTDKLNHIGFVENNEEVKVTANVTFGNVFDLPTPRSSNNHLINLYFSSLSDQGVVSLYFKYSDGSIKNTLIEY